MEYKVYILRTIDTTPRYVGITTGILNTRLVKHIHDIKRKACKNIHKKNWLAKNKENVIIEQIDSSSNIQDLKEKEIFYTGIPAWNNGIPLTEEAKEKQRVKKLGKKDSDETRDKKSKSSKSYLRKKIIECLINDNWVEYESARDAASILGLHRTKIILVCNGTRSHTGGYKFRYKE